MFARKAKSSDLMGSLQRFTDMTRDSVSRVKHLKILLDSLSPQEKRQLIEDHSFETFHLVDELLLLADNVANPQGAVEGESGLWTLEQILCFAPELVGNGGASVYMERQALIVHLLIFEALLLAVGRFRPQRIWTEFFNAFYRTVHWSDRSLGSPTMPGGPLSAKEKAQKLQVYLDKFLGYCTHETSRIEWSDEKKRFQCASFIIDRVNNLYIAECFSDLETNGVDIFGGWEGADDTIEALETADPIVIARYWLIRWVNNLAAVQQLPIEQRHVGVLLYHDALFASHKATNMALSLMREAMTLPLACSNVIQKVVATLSAWLLQYEIPPFVASNEVPVETSSLLLINMLLSFFQSPYLLQPGDRLQSAVTTSYSILRACRDLASQRLNLPRPLSVRVDVPSMSVSGKSMLSLRQIFSRNVIGIRNDCTIQYGRDKGGTAVRHSDVDDKLWDEVNNVFLHGIWIQMAQQWSRISNSVTRALILHLAHVDIFSQEELDKANQCFVSLKKTEMNSENEGGEDNSVDTDSDENSAFLESDDITSAVPTWNGNPTVWLQVWRRFMCVLGPHSVSSANALIAVETLSNTINHLLSVCF
ncbi:unnamed protein product [Strongylus vulgaris]|uniref:Uncharacterized protein n=1 Tax=Strongylus vulgaris TaxID=40348 RepID=A0A3P7IDW6_STRVU|nr:unnamed protein product [Strongylus vulgaris]